MPTYETFLLPDAGEGLTEAEIVQWHVAVGDDVTVNDIILEIETAKSLVDLPTPWTGRVHEVLVAEGTTVDVGAPIIVIDTDPDGEAPAEPSAPAAAEPVSGASSAPSADVAASGGQESSGSGAVLVGYGTAAVSGRRTRRGAGSAAQTVQQKSEPAPSAEPASATASSSHPRTLAKPPVRKLAKDLGIDLTTVHPTGPGGIVTREDLVVHHERTEAQHLAAYDDEPWADAAGVTQDGRQTRVPVRSVRKRTAEAMVHSAFTAPHVTVFATVDVTKTMKLVRRLREDREFADVRITPLLLAAKALLISVDRHPEVNASWDEDAQEIVYKHYVNLGIAAATPRGLVVPNIKDAHAMDLKELATGLGELTATARSGRTTPAAMQDGTITITNVGVFGIDTGTPILNPGEAAILAFGAIREQPWVHKGKIKKRWVTQLALSMDHRLVDGELGSRVLADVARVLEDPAQALVWS
ncbi:dihydrolipoamide acetyltransferase family protein [Paraoerskovia marina]|uniref:dihydrolipoamide acetyltransferase family protein n=1 Tax=Paraoerskovia marina TaxID=545619 RepID=UPI0004926DAE|nr:dihydrolipoamide acetyltransferase family protein [Paraoerskovia marina]